jgi:hypothetical protein
MTFSYLKIYDIVAGSQAELEERRGAFREAQ